jgi:hypothetical protein
MSNGEGLPGVLRPLLVVVLLSVWCFPATGQTAPSAAIQRGAAVSHESSRTPPASEAEALAARERQAPDLQDFKGGGVSIYIGSGVLLVLVIVLVLILII